ncbi:hypothetical protein ABL78_6084 [Leptomonas seymouri]|uniref:BD-FAE-like domain-containing protein n=1 Tax=Leptomonas seymouri TaxID=5684 RepID=A0A0N0P440_LEPSE|nr:hypothetical protein ABL78_6084 [Leptomonas seymouri]|eukprot:KPI84856.1 hypothetical protein ABL78_6084 [Leptomonas seymouri]
MLPYALRQLVWMFTSALQLIYALSTGIVWVLQMLRLFAYGACVGVCFIPHWWWYLTSPNIIRRVSYRSSDTTKRRNILRVLEAEGVDLHEVLRKNVALPPQPLPLVGGRRRRLPAGQRNCGGNNRHWSMVPNESGGADGGGGSSGRHGVRPLPPWHRPMSDVATVSGSRSGPWDPEEMRGDPHYNGSGGGEVMEAALSYPHSQIYSGGADASNPHGHSPSLQRRRPRQVGSLGNPVSALQLPVPSQEGAGEERGDWDPSLPRQQRGRRAVPQGTGALAKGVGPRRRGAAPTTYYKHALPTALEQLMGAAPVDLNPADGSALRSYPMHRPQTRDSAVARRVGGGGRGNDEARVAPRRLRWPSISPHRTPLLTLSLKSAAVERAEVAHAKLSSSSSCDMTVNRLENSSGDDDRGVGNRQSNEALPASCTPQLHSCTLTTPVMLADGAEETDASAPTPAYEGRPVYYDALPKMKVSNDPLLKDMLAALQEGEEERDAMMMEAPSVDAEAGQGHPPRAVLYNEAQRQAVPDERRPDEIYEDGVGREPDRPLRRSRQRRHAPPPPPPPLHVRTFSEENILAGLDEEDEEDKMNLHNRATVDIVLPVPLDALMKTLEYTQHNKRLRRKKFPIVIDVTGAVWIIGSHLWSTMMARVLAQRGYVVFCPDYRNFPQTTMEGMTLDVSDAIAWVLNNAERYNGDLSNVTLIGQSAGAHLTMMSLLSQAQLSAYRNNTLHGTYENVPPPSDVAYNVPRYNPRESIHRYVGLSGMYNIEGLVDHFQREGLNTPVVHQIAGGRDQLARYSIHAYFDDRRGGDTGEVLPDNIFDYFPQRMFFVHGDADKCAPVTESANIVYLMRSAQERYAVRRSARNEEARRHALRSRRLLPGALAATGSTTAGVNDGANEDGAQRIPSGGYRGATAPSSWVQRGAGEDDHRGSDVTMTHDHQRQCYHDVGAEYDDDTKHAELRGGAYGYDGNARTPPSMMGGGAALGESILVKDGGCAHRRPYSTGGSGCVPPRSQHQQRLQPHVPPTMASPIAPPPRQDEPKSPVEMEFIVIPNGRHSDAFVDECIAAGRSCCVDFLCDYESAVDFSSSSVSVSQGNGFDGDSRGGSPLASSSAAHRAESFPAWMAQSSEACAMPDGILPLAVPTEERSLPLRLCTAICPF